MKFEELPIGTHFYLEMLSKPHVLFKIAPISCGHPRFPKMVYEAVYISNPNQKCAGTLCCISDKAEVLTLK